ncbi:MAG: GFA family protein [Ramlibacter sp.]
MERTATCACGQLSLQVRGDPYTQCICHCANCKRRTGSAFGISAYFLKSALVRVKGESSVYALHNSAQDHEQQRHFCSRCGTTLFWFVSTLPEQFGVAGGCFADNGLPAPTSSFTHQKKESWVEIPEGWEIGGARGKVMATDHGAA